MTFGARVALLLLCFLAPSRSEAQGKKPTATASAACKAVDTAVGRSRCMIEAVLRDVQASYSQPGGGGITEIKQVATDTYQVAISQEERVDLLTYELELKPDGAVKIKKRTEGTRTPGR